MKIRFSVWSDAMNNDGGVKILQLGKKQKTGKKGV